MKLRKLKEVWRKAWLGGADEEAAERARKEREISRRNLGILFNNYGPNDRRGARGNIRRDLEAYIKASGEEMAVLNNTSSNVKCM